MASRLTSTILKQANEIEDVHQGEGVLPDAFPDGKVHAGPRGRKKAQGEG